MTEARRLKWLVHRLLISTISLIIVEELLLLLAGLEQARAEREREREREREKEREREMCIWK
jgi:hypothetical protein